METSTRGWLEPFGGTGVATVDDLAERIDRVLPHTPPIPMPVVPTGPGVPAASAAPYAYTAPAPYAAPTPYAVRASHVADPGPVAREPRIVRETPAEPAAAPAVDSSEDLSLVAAVLHPEDADLPILISLVESLCRNSAPAAAYRPSGGSQVAPMPVPLESLQSLPVSPRLL